MDGRRGLAVHPVPRAPLQPAVRPGLREDRVLPVPLLPVERMEEHGEDPSGALLPVGGPSAQVRRIQGSPGGVRGLGVLALEGPSAQDGPARGGDASGPETEERVRTRHEDAEGGFVLCRRRLLHGGRDHDSARQGLLVRGRRAGSARRAARGEPSAYPAA